MSTSTKIVPSSGKPRPPRAGMGRPKGIPNKVTGQLKEMILGALDKAGGMDYLAEQAIASPGAFLTLVGKVLPLQVTGEGGNPIRIESLTRKIVDAPDASHG